ncbi:hypothetical protein JD844_025570 [Phrynosoma platyrhinos]|uniref:Epithelial cell adhesion molecule n=1 Tax=Phrynosoma platyrhinos TaxID=52577 RepID=A0ABQ7SZE8_PHRPL|nr:hypothetical protein JD844_025570 [Phrynosoma platyrhinos]
MDFNITEGCLCEKNKRTVDCVQIGSSCRCKLYGSNVTVDCATLTSKCLLMQAEVKGTVTGRRSKPQTAYVDNDGIYNPECDSKGNFKAKQCNGTNTCWCVNSAGVRRTEKGDQDITCNEVVRTSWIIIEMKHDDRNNPVDQDSIERYILTVFIVHLYFCVVSKICSVESKNQRYTPSALQIGSKAH